MDEGKVMRAERAEFSTLSIVLLTLYFSLTSHLPPVNSRTAAAMTSTDNSKANGTENFVLVSMVHYLHCGSALKKREPSHTSVSLLSDYPQ